MKETKFRDYPPDQLPIGFVDPKTGERERRVRLRGIRGKDRERISQRGRGMDLGFAITRRDHMAVRNLMPAYLNECLIAIVGQLGEHHDPPESMVLDLSTIDRSYLLFAYQARREPVYKWEVEWTDTRKGPQAEPAILSGELDLGDVDIEEPDEGLLEIVNGRLAYRASAPAAGITEAVVGLLTCKADQESVQAPRDKAAQLPNFYRIASMVLDLNGQGPLTMEAMQNEVEEDQLDALDNIVRAFSYGPNQILQVDTDDGQTLLTPIDTALRFLGGTDPKVSIGGASTPSVSSPGPVHSESAHPTPG